MSVDLLLGLQWGDEGKGKIVDVLTADYDIIARFQGGPNAGHTLKFDGISHVLHTIPSGIFKAGIRISCEISDIRLSIGSREKSSLLHRSKLPASIAK